MNFRHGQPYQKTVLTLRPLQSHSFPEIIASNSVEKRKLRKAFSMMLLMSSSLINFCAFYVKSKKKLRKSKRKIGSFRLKPKIEIVSDSLVRSSLTEPAKRKLTNSNSVAGFPREDFKSYVKTTNFRPDTVCMK